MQVVAGWMECTTSISHELPPSDLLLMQKATEKASLQEARRLRLFQRFNDILVNAKLDLMLAE